MMQMSESRNSSRNQAAAMNILFSEKSDNVASLGDQQQRQSIGEMSQRAYGQIKAMNSFNTPNSARASQYILKKD